MGQFRREGRFRDRASFLTKVKEKVAKLRQTTLVGMTEVWEREDGADIGRLAGFGVTLVFTVREEAWECAAEIPEWLPIPQSKIEEKFDKEFADLKSPS
jgi:hypothetical protein